MGSFSDIDGGFLIGTGYFFLAALLLWAWLLKK